MNVAVGVARNGSQAALPEVDKVLDLIALLDLPLLSSVYLSAFHALARSARAGKPGLDDAEALLCSMLDPEAQLPSSTATAARGGQCDIMERMQQAQVMPNSLVYDGLQVAVGSAKRGELDMEDLESHLQSLLHSGESLTHAHAESLLAAAVLGMEGGRLCMRQLDLLVQYIGHAPLELDVLCLSLWLRGVAHAVRERQARIQEPCFTLWTSLTTAPCFSTAALRFLALAVADHVRALLLEKKSDKVLLQQN
jgi:hypothetical protein